MSDRQRFFVEMKEGEVTVISWTQLVADAERISVPGAAAAPSDSPATLSLANLNLAAAREKSRRLKLDPICTVTLQAERKRKSIVNTVVNGSLKVAKVESDEPANKVGPATLKGKVHESLPISSDSVRPKTSRIKKKTKKGRR